MCAVVAYSPCNIGTQHSTALRSRWPERTQEWRTRIERQILSSICCPTGNIKRTTCFEQNRKSEFQLEVNFFYSSTFFATDICRHLAVLDYFGVPERPLVCGFQIRTQWESNPGPSDHKFCALKHSHKRQQRVE